MQPLSGILVIALEQAAAAPLATCRLADAGARVIKIERPGGDFARGYDAVVNGESSYFVWLNRGKESVVLDLKQPDDLVLLKRMVARADVFVQNLAPGATERLGIGSAELRARYPRLITCDISGYGDSLYRDMKAYDFLVQCESGLVALSGGESEIGRIGVSICDVGTGLNAFGGIMQALFLRERSGKGSGVRVSLFDSAVEWMQVPLAHFTWGAGAPRRVGLHHPSIAPYGAYETADGNLVVIAIQNNREWARFAREVLARPDLVDDPRCATNNARVAHRDLVNDAIKARFATLTRADLVARLDAARIAYGAINSVEDVAEHPALRYRPMPVGEAELRLIASPIRHGSESGPYPRVPSLGEHTAQVRAEFDGTTG